MSGRRQSLLEKRLEMLLNMMERPGEDDRFDAVRKRREKQFLAIDQQVDKQANKRTIWKAVGSLSA